jgi:hypothetical protein
LKADGRFRTDFHATIAPDAFVIVVAGNAAFALRFTYGPSGANGLALIAQSATVSGRHRFFDKKVFERFCVERPAGHRRPAACFARNIIMDLKLIKTSTLKVYPLKSACPKPSLLSEGDGESCSEL